MTLEECEMAMERYWENLELLEQEDQTGSDEHEDWTDEERTEH